MINTITIENNAQGFIAQELMQRLAAGYVVTMVFGGRSMRPLISGIDEKVELQPLDAPLQVGDIYLFVHNNHLVVHRLISLKDGQCTFRGDNCHSVEKVDSSAVRARLKTVIKGDGTRISCDSPSWKFRSRCVAFRRTVVNSVFSLFKKRNRLWMRWVYFLLLAILMWAPVGVVGVPLNNFVLGIRLDHLLHASVYIPCTFFLFDFFSKTMPFSRPRTVVLLFGILIGIVTETGQYLLPYRGFDINDLISNALGVSLGFLVVKLYSMRK